MQPHPASQKALLKCSHCSKLVNTEKTGGLVPITPVFKSFTCNFCSNVNYTVKCICKTLIISRVPMYFGQKISCTSCQRNMNIVPCPVCKQMNLWNGDYYMGAYINCFQCKSLTFQHIACPFCHEPNFWVTNKSILSYYKCGLPVNCYVCKKKFQHLMCPHCHEANFFNNVDYIQGIKQNCSSCKQSFQHVNCPGCGDPSFYKNCDFSFGKNYKCRECKANFCMSICDKCGSSNSIVNKIIEVNTSYFECCSCKNQYNLLSCPFCRGPNYPITEKGKCAGNMCLYCKKVFKVLDCPVCNHVSCCVCAENSSKNKHKCAFCKTETANTNKIDEISENRKKSVSQTPENTASEEEKDKFLCKICYDKPVNTIFIKCKHVCACFECASSLKKKECPICRVVGDFQKCFL